MQGEVINLKSLKKLLWEEVGQSLASKVLVTLHADCIQACSLTNKELMDCIHTPWAYMFGQGNCLKAWEVTGILPFTWLVQNG